MKKLIQILALFFIASCRNNGFYQPYTMDMTLPDGPPEYKAGWRAGCRTGLSVKFFTNSYVYKMDFGDGTYHHEGLFNAGYVDAIFACYEQTNTFGMKDMQGPLE